MPGTEKLLSWHSEVLIGRGQASPRRITIRVAMRLSLSQFAAPSVLSKLQAPRT
jgi:hypothetical protein